MIAFPVHFQFYQHQMQSKQPFRYCLTNSHNCISRPQRAELRAMDNYFQKFRSNPETFPGRFQNCYGTMIFLWLPFSFSLIKSAYSTYCMLFSLLYVGWVMDRWLISLVLQVYKLRDTVQ